MTNLQNKLKKRWGKKFIDKRDWRTYWELYETISASLRPPDLMVYLQCPVRTLKQRIALLESQLAPVPFVPALAANIFFA